MKKIDMPNLRNLRKSFDFIVTGPARVMYPHRGHEYFFKQGVPDVDNLLTIIYGVPEYQVDSKHFKEYYETNLGLLSQKIKNSIIIPAPIEIDKSVAMIKAVNPDIINIFFIALMQNHKWEKKVITELYDGDPEFYDNLVKSIDKIQELAYMHNKELEHALIEHTPSGKKFDLNYLPDDVKEELDYKYRSKNAIGVDKLSNINILFRNNTLEWSLWEKDMISDKLLLNIHGSNMFDVAIHKINGKFIVERTSMNASHIREIYDLTMQRCPLKINTEIKNHIFYEKYINKKLEPIGWTYLENSVVPYVVVKVTCTGELATVPYGVVKKNDNYA